MIATVVTSLETRTLPPYIYMEYLADGVDATSVSGELIALPLPNNVTRIDLKVVGADCTSSNFDFILLDKNDISALNTVHEVLKYTGESYTFTDNDFKNYVIVNRDVTETNRLYVYINNHAGASTGPITIKLVYIPMSTGETML